MGSLPFTLAVLKGFLFIFLNVVYISKGSSSLSLSCPSLNSQHALLFSVTRCARTQFRAKPVISARKYMGSFPFTLTVLKGLFFSIVQELCESRGDRPGLSVLTSLLVSVDVKLY